LNAISSIRSDGWPVRGQITGGSRPSSGVTFSQKSPSFRLQYGDEIPDTDQRIILVTFLCRERSFGAFVGQFFDPTLHLRFGM
jgi:hypothetical protein